MGPVTALASDEAGWGALLTVAPTVGKLGPWIRQGSGRGSTLGLRKQTPGLGKAGKQGQWATKVCEGSLFRLWLLHQFPGGNGSLEVQVCE